MARGWWLVVVGLLGCNEPVVGQRCGALPDLDACPIGSTCNDRDCTALYACREGDWELVQTCDHSAPTAGAAGTAGSAGAAGASGAAGSAGASCAQPSTPASELCPTLSGGDCDATLLELCLGDACALGCDGFLRCDAGEWSDKYVAYCTEDGELITPP